MEGFKMQYYNGYEEIDYLYMELEQLNDIPETELTMEDLENIDNLNYKVETILNGKGL